MTKILEGKPHSLVDAMLANQDTEEAVRAANKRLQEEGSTSMNAYRVTYKDIEEWPADIRLMVEEGCFSPNCRTKPGRPPPVRWGLGDPGGHGR